MRSRFYTKCEWISVYTVKASNSRSPSEKSRVNRGAADTNIVGKPAEEKKKKTVVTRLQSSLNPSEFIEMHQLEVVRSVKFM